MRTDADHAHAVYIAYDCSQVGAWEQLHACAHGAQVCTMLAWYACRQGMDVRGVGARGILGLR